MRRGACKPGSVPGVVSQREGPYAAAAAIPLGETSLPRSSDQPGLPGFETNPPISPAFARRRRAAPIRSCSGWGLPSRLPLPAARCALTAPFHPYLLSEENIGGLLSVALSLGFGRSENRPRPAGVTCHPCFVEPGLSSRSSKFPWRPRGCPAPRVLFLAWSPKERDLTPRRQPFL